MTTLKKYQSLEHEYNELKLESRTIIQKTMRGREENVTVTNQEEIDAEREKVAGRLALAIPLLKKQLEIRHTLETLGSLHGYIDVQANCSGCGVSFQSTSTLFENYTFNKALCKECSAREANLKEAKLIEGGKNLKPVFDNFGDLVRISFESGGKKYVIHREDNESNDRPLTVEKE